MTSLLNNDKYKFSVAQLVHAHFPDMYVRYELFDRTKKLNWSRQFSNRVQLRIKDLLNSQFTDTDLQYLSKHFDEKFVEFLRTFRFPPNCVLFGNGELSFTGRWIDVVLLEVPLLTILSEEHYKTIDVETKLVEFIKKTNEFKTQAEFHGIKFAEYGTRRRRNSLFQEIAIDAFSSSKNFLGTSNLALAKKYDIPAIGTFGHELPMALSAIFGPRLANQVALSLYQDHFHSTTPIALTDTFTTEVFLRDFHNYIGWGLRHDSGDPIKFVDVILAYYEKLNIPTEDKIIMFSNSLDIHQCVRIEQYIKGILKTSYGIGTSITNPFDDALNIVIKMTEANGKPVVKLSDDPKKSIGNPHIIEKLRKELNGLFV